MLLDKSQFLFVYAKYSSSYMSEVCHFVTQEVTTAKSAHTPSLTRKLQNLCSFGQYYPKELFKKSATEEMGSIKAFLVFDKLK